MGKLIDYVICKMHKPVYSSQNSVWTVGLKKIGYVNIIQENKGGYKKDFRKMQKNKENYWKILKKSRVDICLKSDYNSTV